MKTKRALLLCDGIAALCLCLLLAAPAALAEDNTHTTVDVDTRLFPQDFIVGNTGTNNTLLVTAPVGGKVELWDNNGVVGSSATANDNSATVTSGAVWLNYGSLAVGLYGSRNSLILNQGAAGCRLGYVGYTASSCDNSVIIRGVAGIWSATDSATVGFYGSGNLLHVEEAGNMLTYGGNGFIGNAAGANNNKVLIEGHGAASSLYSKWDMNATGTTCLLIGNNGGNGNGLELSNYGQLNNVDGVAVGGWQGGGSAGNYVNIINGGALLMTATLGEDFWIGNNAGANGNWVYVGSGNGVQSLLDLGASGKRLLVGGNNGATSNNRLTVDGGGLVNNGSIWVGNGNGNAMAITNGGVVASAAFSTIGWAAGDAGNSATITGPGSTWSISSNLYVGAVGSSNTLTIANGGQVVNAGGGWIGYWGNNSSVTVTGTGSVWNNNGDLYVGVFGSSNTLTIADGGAVSVGGNLVVSAGASNNTVNVDGGQVLVTNGALFVNAAGAWGSGELNISSGTVLVKQLTTTNANGVINFNGGTIISQGTIYSNGTAFVVGDTGGNATFIANGGTHSFQNKLVIGNSSSGNTMTISNAATVINTAGYIGYAAGANNNAVLVTGSGSVWSNSSELYVGYNGSGNSLTIADGGAVFSAGNSFIGYAGGANSNRVEIAGAGSSWDMRDTTDYTVLMIGNNGGVGNGLRVSDGGLLTNVAGVCVGGWNGSGSAGNYLVITNGGKVVLNGSTIEDFWIGNNAGASGNWAYIGSATGTHSVLDLGAGTKHVYIGGNNGATSNNRLTVDGGGVVTNGSIWIGNGSGNAMVITHGGRVFSAADSRIGWFASDTSNTVTVSGAGSVWNNSGELYVGYFGSGNALVITNGGTVFNNGVNMGAVIGGGAGAGNNAVLVTGSNSVWNNSSDVWVGYGGFSNTLTVRNGGQVYNDGGVIGCSGNNNAVLVAGVGSVWSNSGVLYIGWETGSSNSLTIADGGRVYSGGGGAKIGVLPDASHNLVLVTGAGSVWNNSTNLAVGWDSSGNALIITNGGAVFNGTAFIGQGANVGGYPSNANNNTVLVTGAGSVWSNSGNIYVGNQGSGNSLTIANNGTVFNNYGYIGNSNGANNNAVLVTGAGSVWNNALGIYVGYLGSSNSLTISNGGRVDNYSNIGIGYWPDACNNAVTVTGTDSVWTSTGDIYIGGGSGNALTIANGGKMYNFAGFIGCYSSASSNNAVLVTGPGSLWRNNDALYVGKVGSGNSLTISNGGTVFNAYEGVIGYDTTANRNTVLVTGSNSVWNNSGELYVGQQGSGNTLTIANNGTVSASNIVIGANPSTGNGITVSGGNLYATNAASTGSLDVRNGTLALNGGTVVANQLVATNGANSAVSFSAGLLRSGGSTVSNGSALVVGDGVQSATYDMLGGTHSFASGLSISTNGNLIGNGDIIGSVTNFGIIAPGHSAGLITFSGDLTLQDSSTLNFEIGGATTNAYDRVWVGGLLRIGGLLNVTFTGGYTGNAGDSFDLFDFGSVNGMFSQTNLPTLGAGKEWETSGLYTSGTVSIVPEPGAAALLALGLGVLRRRRRG